MNAIDLTGRTAIVTGGARGIGYACAIRLLISGATGRFVEPEEIAALVAWFSSEECSFSTGAVFDISGGRATY